jgi:hypothetical protein
MPRSQKPVQKKIKPAAKKAVRAKLKSPAKIQASMDYREYLERYAVVGADRPKLSSTAFEKLDDELLDLLALEILDDDQIIRKHELEYLLLDSEE